MSFLIGLTGGIASGKSTVAKYFIAYGIEVIDADKIARDIVEPGTPCLKQIHSHFGSKILNKDGSLNRRQLRNIIFKNPNERIWLEELLHPVIRQVIHDQTINIQSAYGIVMIPLLVDKTSYPMLDRILVVDVDESIQVERIKLRDNVNTAHAKSILKAQISPEERCNMADDIIENNNNLDNIQASVANLHHTYLAMSQCHDKKS